MPKGIPNKSPEPSKAFEKTEETVRLEDGTIYKTVAGRKATFNQQYREGMIVPELITDPNNKDYFVFKVTVIPDFKNKERFFVGYGQCERINGDKFASLEKAETTAIGRALSHMSDTLIGAGASEDEINKSTGVTALQKSIKESVAIETKKDKEVAAMQSLSKQDNEQLETWLFHIQNTVTKEALIEMGSQIKKEQMSSVVVEALRKAFNERLKTIKVEGEKNVA